MSCAEGATPFRPVPPVVKENAMKRTAIVIVLLAFTTSHAAAFSSPGHQAIAEVAQDRLSPATRAAVGRILQDSGDLAPWCSGGGRHLAGRHPGPRSARNHRGGMDVR
jgi:hypothetical protein